MQMHQKHTWLYDDIENWFEIAPDMDYEAD